MKKRIESDLRWTRRGILPTSRCWALLAGVVAATALPAEATALPACNTTPRTIDCFPSGGTALTSAHRTRLGALVQQVAGLLQRGKLVSVGFVGVGLTGYSPLAQVYENATSRAVAASSYLEGELKRLLGSAFDRLRGIKLLVHPGSKTESQHPRWGKGSQAARALSRRVEFWVTADGETVPAGGEVAPPVGPTPAPSGNVAFFQGLIERAKGGYDVASIPLKPDLPNNLAICRDAGCAKYCSGSRPNMARALPAFRHLGNHVVTTVDPAVAVQAQLRTLGCEPAGGPKLGYASMNCGIRFYFTKYNRGVLPAVARGLARAALEAAARGYVLVVGSTHRPFEEQLRKVCSKLSRGITDACGGGLACPGASPHGSGFAIDAALERNGRFVTRIIGSAGKTCPPITRKIRGDPHLRALNDIMFAAGWFRYCKEWWHFEYSRNPVNSSRTRTY